MTVQVKRFRRAIAVVLTGVLLSGSVAAQDFPDVTAISLEDLMNLKVTSVSKREQKLADSAAAIFVITQDDIRRSGARSIPEALRLVPGLEVARIDENKWAIASRGFNGRFTNKLLVLIDGRSVYTPLFSGVYWNVQDVLLEDVDRIEVIRGPGATLWGANAVNGVINIMTKTADATPGGLVTAQAGDALQGAGQVRYGGKWGDVSYRAYSKYFKWDSSTDEKGQNAFDGWNAARMGFRIDGGSREGDAFTVQGDIYDGEYGETLTGALLTAPYVTTFRNSGGFSGGNVLGRWTHSFGRSATSLQMYFDRANNAHTALLYDHLNTYDVDFQHDIRISDNHDWIWGVGYRLTDDNATADTYVRLSPNERTWTLFSAFAQDEFTLFADRLRVTVGSKFEHNGFTGFEAEPNGRVLWNLTPSQGIWGAVSRAVRTPARTEQDMQLDAAVLPPSAASGGLPIRVSVLGDRDFQSEDLVAYESGYRVNLGRTVSLDLAAFYNSYGSLLSAEPALPTVALGDQPMHIVAPLVADNKMSGATYGSELFAEWRPASMFKMNGAYTFLRMNIDRDRDSLDSTSADPAGSSPRHQFSMRSSLDLTRSLQQDFTWRYVGGLDGLAIPSYYSLDAHLGWAASKRLNFSISGQNLTNNEHLEFRPDFIATSPTVVKRTYQVTARWQF
jgi:iron complex outermembrane receptor protein